MLLLGEAAEWSVEEVSWPINTEIFVWEWYGEKTEQTFPVSPCLFAGSRVLRPAHWLAASTPCSWLLWASAHQLLSCQKPCCTESWSLCFTLALVFVLAEEPGKTFQSQSARMHSGCHSLADSFSLLQKASPLRYVPAFDPSLSPMCYMLLAGAGRMFS